MNTDDKPIWSPTRAVTVVGLVIGIAATIGVFVLSVGPSALADRSVSESFFEFVATPGLVLLRVFHYDGVYGESPPWGMFIVCTIINGCLCALTAFFAMDTAKLVLSDIEATRARLMRNAARGRVVSIREVRILAIWGFAIGCSLTLIFTLVPLFAFGGAPGYYPVLQRTLHAPSLVFLGILGIEIPRTIAIWSMLVNGAVLAGLIPLAVWCWRRRIIRRSALA